MPKGHRWRAGLDFAADRVLALADALEVAKSCQITGSGFREIAREIAGHILPS
jgi:hypothetical protein